MVLFDFPEIFSCHATRVSVESSSLILHGTLIYLFYGDDDSLTTCVVRDSPCGPNN